MSSQPLPIPHPEPPHRPTSHGGRAWRILVIEDDRDTADTMSILLRYHGYEVATAADGPAALALAETLSPEVVLLDLGLPRMDGLEVARRLREQSHSTRPLVVAVTGFGGDEDRVRSYKAGIDLHLTKPVSVEELLRFLGKFQAVKDS